MFLSHVNEPEANSPGLERQFCDRREHRLLICCSGIFIMYSLLQPSCPSGRPSSHLEKGRCCPLLKGLFPPAPGEVKKEAGEGGINNVIFIVLLGAWLSQGPWAHCTWQSLQSWKL